MAPSPSSDRLQPARNDHDFVGVHGGRLIYVLVAKRAEFDLIALPMSDNGETENGHVLTKALDAGGLYIVFQHWLKERTIEAMRADMERKRTSTLDADEVSA